MNVVRKIICFCKNSPLVNFFSSKVIVEAEEDKDFFKVSLFIDRRRSKNTICPADKTSLLHNYLKNGIWYVIGGRERPAKVYNADLCRCPKCHSLILTDFGRKPNKTLEITPDLKAVIEEVERRGCPVIYEERK